MTRKGLIKLATRPHIFLRDYIKKKQQKFEYLIPKKKVMGEYQYTVVSAVYNVSPYLDEYFKSLIDQSLDFKKHIFLVLVDDGSTDNSAKIIKKWQKKYPHNITYLKKENGGQASARNVGLDYVKTEWVTFVDPDDFVDKIYFENIDSMLQKDKKSNIGMVGCQWKIYQENKKSYNLNHPLNFRFKDGNRVCKYKSDKKFLPSSVATSLYRYSVIQEFNIRFNEDIKPNFEDGYFSAKYFLYMKHDSIAYAANSFYIYRKRASGDSTLDSSWHNKNRFNTVLKKGYLALLEDEINKENIPYALQRLIMYDIFWYFKKIINTPQSIAFLTHDEKQEFKALVYRVFRHIDKEVILNFELAGFWFYHKVGFLGMLKDDKPSFNIVYIDDYDKDKKLLKLRYFYYQNPPLEEYKVDGNYTVPVYSKTRTHYFLDDIFVMERSVWIDISKTKNNISINLFNEDTRVSFNKKEYRGDIPVDDIIKYGKKEVTLDISKIPLHIKIIRKTAKSNKMQERYQDAYVVMDRDTQADDNGEHFYRYLKENHPELNIFFILSEASHDYKRLKENGFNLLAFNSLNHKCALLNAKYLISSHADKYVVDYLRPHLYGDMINYKFIFLQHGVIRDDISTWLNNKNIDAFITSMPSEHNSIAGDSRYKFTPKETVLTGLARHDRLVQRDEPTQNVILIMPTWRNSLVGDLENMSAKRDVSDEFYNSDYAKHWKSFLHSDRLKELAFSFKYKVVFFPHVNMSIYIEWFDAPSWIEVRTHQTDPILHKLFRRTKVMITDYSSVFFEMAILKKAILYYQFDFEYMYGGNHSSQLGYFDFEKDGFGEVSYKEEELFLNLETVLNNGGEPNDEYLNRMINSLPFRDGKNRERTLHAIKDLENPLEKKEPSSLLYHAYLTKAKKSCHRELIKFYLTLLIKQDRDDKALAIELIDNEIKLGNLKEAKELLDFYPDINEHRHIEFMVHIEKGKKSIALLSKETQETLESSSLFELTIYSNIEKTYKENNWLLLIDICSLVEIETVPENKRSYFYYMWGRALRQVGEQQRALKILATSLSYNDIAPNASLWEYSSSFYESYNEDEMTKELLLREFRDNKQRVENIEYKLIQDWFKNGHYRQVSVAFELIDVMTIKPKEEKSFYSMWGKTLFLVGRYADSIEKFKNSSDNSQEILVLNAKSMTHLEVWEESYNLWLSIYKKYPSYSRAEVLKNIIWALKNLNREDELKRYKDIFLKWKFLNSSQSDIEILNTL